MKKHISLIVTLILTMSVILMPCTMAAENKDEETKNEQTLASGEQTKPTTYTLSLEAAIKLAMTDNPQLIANEHAKNANEINIKSAHLTKAATEDAVKAAGKFGIMSATTMEELCSRRGYYVSAAEVQYDMSVIEKSRIEATISYNVTNSYYNAVLMDMFVTAAENSHKLALENKTVVDEQFKQGLVPKMAYDNAGISVDGAKSMLDAYKLNRDIAYRNLINLLNVEKDSALVLTDDIKVEEFTSDVQKDIASALETRYDIIGVKKQLELAEKYLDISDAFTERSAVYNTAYADYINKEYQYKSAKDGIDLAIRASYNTIVSNYSAMEIANRKYEMNLSEYKAAKLQYELGMITNIELTDKINALYDSQIEHFQAKLNYRMAVEKYKYDISVGLPQ